MNKRCELLSVQGRQTKLLLMLSLDIRPHVLVPTVTPRMLGCDLIEQELCKHHVFNISAAHIRVFQAVGGSYLRTE